MAQQARIDAQLTIGQVTESVNVSASAVLLEITSSNLGQVVTNRQVTELPLNGRNPFALAALTPGVTPLASFGAGLTGARGAAQTAGVNNFTSNGGITGANEISARRNSDHRLLSGSARTDSDDRHNRGIQGTDEYFSGRIRPHVRWHSKHPDQVGNQSVPWHAL